MHRSRIHRPPLVAATAAVGVLAIVLSGCGRADTAAEPTASTAIDDSPATGTVTVWAPEGDATGLDEVLAPFYAENPDVDVELTLIPSDEYTTKLQTAVSAGTTPDLAFLYTESQLSFTSSGAFATVPDGVADSDSFFPGAWDAGAYQGATYSVPWYAYTRVLIYRSDLAEAGGVEAPETWDDWIPFLKGLQAGGAETGFGGDIGWDVYSGQAWSTYAYQAGSTLLNADGTEWDLDSPEAVEATAQFAAPFLEGVASLDSPTFLDSSPYFVQGKTGAMVSGPWVIANVDTAAGQEGWKDDHVQTAVLPAGPAGSIGQLAGGSWGVLDDAENADAAWKVVRFLAQTDTQVAQYESHGSMPAVEAAWQDPVIADQPLLDAFFEQMSTAEPLPAVPTIAEVLTLIGNQTEAVARGITTPEEAMANVQSQAESIGLGE